jgi:hypothetical protein
MEALARGKGGISGGWRASMAAPYREKLGSKLDLVEIIFRQIFPGDCWDRSSVGELRHGIFKSGTSSFQAGGRRRKRDGLVAPGFYFTFLSFSVFGSI